MKENGIDFVLIFTNADAHAKLPMSRLFPTLTFLLTCTLLGLIACSATGPVVVEGPVDCRPENFVTSHADQAWSPAEISSICSLWIGNLPELPADPTNRVAENLEAAKLGQRIFFDTAFSASGGISCATCHDPEKNFTDGLALPIGGGPRKSQTIVGTAYSPWLFWDGHSDSQWAQALEPLESDVEHRGTRTQYAELVRDDASYRADYEAVFGPVPDLADEQAVTEVFVNIGKAIAAYERLIIPGASPFDTYAQAVIANDTRTMDRALSAEAVAGLDLFINAGNCIDCHNGPLFTNNEFHGTAVVGIYDAGRLEGAQLVLENEFNCYSEWSDSAESCPNLRFIRTEGFELEAAFKTPTLRNVAEMAPYTHNGSFADLQGILAHYNTGGFGSSFGTFGHNELEPLNLEDQQLAELEAFMRALSGGYATDEQWLSAP